MILQLSGRPFNILVVRKSEVSRLTITVYPDFRIVVTSPPDASSEEIELRIHRRIGWIEKQICFFEKFLPREPKRRFISGESHRYLGRQYRLKVELSEIDDAKLKGRLLQVQATAPNDTEVVSRIVYSWYNSRSRKVFEARLDECHRRSKDVLKIPAPTLVIRKMTKRWGSFTASGRLILNVDLIKQRTDLIDYVIMHELCHSRQPNHSKRFQALMNRVMPDWRERRFRLDSTPF